MYGNQQKCKGLEWNQVWVLETQQCVLEQRRPLTWQSKSWKLREFWKEIKKRKYKWIEQSIYYEL